MAAKSTARKSVARKPRIVQASQPDIITRQNALDMALRRADNNTQALKDAKVFYDFLLGK